MPTKTYKVQVKILGVTKIDSNTVVSSWTGSIYRVDTDKGPFLRNAQPSGGVEPYDWSGSIGQTVDAVMAVARNNPIATHWLKRSDEHPEAV